MNEFRSVMMTRFKEFAMQEQLQESYFPGAVALLGFILEQDVDLAERMVNGTRMSTEEVQEALVAEQRQDESVHITVAESSNSYIVKPERVSVSIELYNFVKSLRFFYDQDRADNVRDEANRLVNQEAEFYIKLKDRILGPKLKDVDPEYIKAFNLVIAAFNSYVDTQEQSTRSEENWYHVIENSIRFRYPASAAAEIIAMIHFLPEKPECAHQETREYDAYPKVRICTSCNWINQFNYSLREWSKNWLEPSR